MDKTFLSHVGNEDRNMANDSDVNLILKQIRKDIFLTAYKGGSASAHLASAYSSVEILYVLYTKIMNYNPEKPSWKDRDRLILSKGHASLALYKILNMVGIISNEQLKSFCHADSRLGGEPNMTEVPGIEATTGSLGHGLSFGIGMAMAAKMSGYEYKVYVILGDGECQEGSVWEAVMSASRYKLNNLVVVMDYNRIQKMDLVNNTMNISCWDERWESFGWNVLQVDGHNICELENIFSEIPQNDKPSVIIANTVKGKGVSIMENNPEWHYRMPNRKQLKIFMNELGISEEELV